jgi:hypothetical protein
MAGYGTGAYAAVPYAGMVSAVAPPPPNPGSTDDFPTLTLRYSLTGPLVEPAWVTVEGCVRAVQVTRGRSDETSAWEAGTCEIVLGNAERQFDPDNPDSPHAGYLTVNRRIRLEATYADITYVLFDGFADRWEQVPGAGQANNYAECNLVATDVFKLLGRIRMEATDALILDDVGDGVLGEATLAGPYEFGEENAGSRARTILRSSALPDGMWAVDAAATILVADRPEVDTSIDEYLERIATSIGGDLVVTADGTVNLWDRWRWSYVDTAGTSTATWSDVRDAIPGLPYRELDLVASDERTVVNIVQRGRADGFSARKRDRTSIETYGPAEDTRDDLLTEDVNEIVSQVEYLLGRATDPRPRVAGMVIVPQRSAADLFPQVLGRELGDRFTLVRTVAGVGTPFVADFQIDRIEHSAGPKVWSTTWSASLADTTDLFTLDVGVLDGTSPLAY